MDGEPRKEKGTIVWGKEGRLIFSYLSEGKFPLDLLGGCLFGFVCKNDDMWVPPQSCEFGGSCVQLPLTAHRARNSSLV